MLVTVQLALLSFFFAFVIGLVVASCRVSPVPPLQRAAALYTQVARNTPLTVLMVIALFALPDVGFLFSPFTTAVGVLSIYTGAFLAETFRAGINSVPVGQGEAARAIGLGFGGVLTLIVLPQALRTVVAPIGSLFIALTKNTSVAYVISVVERTGIGRVIGNPIGRPLEALLGSALGYLVLLIPAGLFFGWLEQRLAIVR